MSKFIGRFTSESISAVRQLGYDIWVSKQYFFISGVPLYGVHSDNKDLQKIVKLWRVCNMSMSFAEYIRFMFKQDK